MSDVLARTESRVLRITLNRPDTGNKVSDEMVVELTKQIQAAGENVDLIVLRGAGDNFCLGRSRTGAPRPSEAFDRRASNEMVFDLYRAVRNAKVPLVCGIQGQAVGFGCAIAAISDIAVATEDAQFSTPEMEHGILPTVVLSTFIDRVPRKAINYLIYSSAAVDAQRALSFGLICDVVAGNRLDATIDALCASILKAPAVAIRGVKEYMRSAADLPIEGAVDYARNLHAVINSSRHMRDAKA